MAKWRKIFCGARTRAGHPCRRRPLANGRCRNHGGLSLKPRAPLTPEGRARISAAVKAYWESYRVAKALAATAPQ
jgi:hypothetical protein